MEQQSHYEFRDSRASDVDSLVDLFNRVFGEGVGARDAAQWRWRYLENPYGLESRVAVCRTSGHVIGHVGGYPVRLWQRSRDGVDGTVARGAQTVDHMVDPSARSGLKRRGVFARLMRSWVDEYCGADRNWIGWGFPSLANFRIGERLCDYSFMREVDVLAHTDVTALAQQCASAGCSTMIQLDAPADVDALWTRWRRNVALGVVRDHAFLHWRYALDPGKHYAFVCVRDVATSALAALAVVRSGGLADDVATVMEWMVAPVDKSSHAQTSRALMAACVTWAGQDKLAGFVTSTSTIAEDMRVFADLGFREHETGIRFVANSWAAHISVDDVRDTFYLALGDIDFL